MKKTIESIISKIDQTSLEMMTFEPEGEIRGVLQIAHGMAEHKERYSEFMEFCVKAGYVCVIHDHRGHGNSVKTNEDLGYFKDDCGCAIVKDVKQITDIIKERYRDQPVILMGHSMGSLVVRNYMRMYDSAIQGLIVCGSPSKNPAISAALALTKAMVKVKGERYRSKLIDDLAFKSYGKKFGEVSPFAWICSDSAVVKAYEEDEKCGVRFTLNGFLNLFTLMEKTYTKQGWQMRNRFAPIFFIAGEEDPCIVSVAQFKKAVGFMCEVGYEKVQSKLYPNVRHEILNDISKQEVMHDIVQFMNEIVSAK